MVDTPKQLLRGDYTGTSLPLERQQRMAELVGIVQETPSAYEAHIEIIKILHQGLVDHIYPSSSPNARNDPGYYDLLLELRQARESADKLFAVGQEQWQDWLQDESILARSTEERVAVIELCRRAVDEEYSSSSLWSTYGDWISHCYAWAHEPAANATQEEEKMMGREVFRREDVLSTWEEGVRQTKHDIAQSHLVWNKHIKARFPDLEDKVSDESAVQILDLFQSRLMNPHAEWESTFRSFSSFVSANFPAQQYEQIMAETTDAAAAAKAVYQAREPYEAAVARAAEQDDKYAEYRSFIDYIAWEREEEQRLAKMNKKQKKREPIQDPAASARLINALYQRAELRLPTVLSLWEDHASYLSERRNQREDTSSLDLLLRAAKHCPWSGSLWKRLLLASEIADHPFSEIEAVQQDATKTGMVDAAGIEEVLKVHDAWCGYLVRRTRRPDATEEDADVAEMGIRTSMEAIQSLASKVDGEANIDASFRLQRKYIEYLKGQGRFDNARKQFDDAAPVYGKFYRFWLRFYEFEMQASLHISSLQQDSRDGVTLHSSAPYAVGILKKGLENPRLDYPEYLMEALINHCEDYEDAEELQSALLFVDGVQKQLDIRRQYEAEAAAEHATAAPADARAEERTEAVAQNLHNGKRKRLDTSDDDDVSKRTKNESLAESIEQPTEELKRDREHASILVQNISMHTSETRIRQYFSTCGSVLSVKAIPFSSAADVRNDGCSYVVEFSDSSEAQYALSRNERDLDGTVISVTLNTGNTLYVTNYPAEYAETDIRGLFTAYGEIVTVRFPSLQANKRRRFCYVEMKSAEEASHALELNGRELTGLKIVVAISNPAVRKARDTTHHQPPLKHRFDGFTVFVGQLPFKAREEEITEFFSHVGEVVQLKLPRDSEQSKRNKGIAFVTFSTKASAEAAVDMNGQEFQGRRIKVSRAKEEKPSSGRGSSVNDGRSASPASEDAPGWNSRLNGAVAGFTSPAARPSVAELEEQRARTVFLASVPDTVNEAQLRSVASSYGSIRKVILKTQYAGAIIEFSSASDAGKAEIGLENHEFVLGKPVRTVTEQDMKHGTPELKNEKLGGKPQKALQPTTAAMMAPTSVRRPAKGTKKGGNLGKRTGLGWGAPDKKTDVDGEANGSDLQNANGARSSRAAKSNDDFRAMLGQSND